MGGERGVAEQRKRGKLTVRERVELLADPGTFRELMGLMGAGSYAPDDPRQLVDFLPKGAVDGVCKLNGRKAIFHAGDFTVRGGSGGSGGGMGMELSAKQRAIEWRLPYIRLLDAAGGSVATFEPTKNKNATFFSCTGNKAFGRYCQALSTVSYSAEAKPGTTRGGHALQSSSVILATNASLKASLDMSFVSCGRSLLSKIQAPCFTLSKRRASGNGTQGPRFSNSLYVTGFGAL